MAGVVDLAAGPETWGTVGQWFSGAMSTVAVGVALWVALRDRRRYDAERRDAEKQQARLLIIKPVVVSDRFVRIVLHNRSHEPLPSVWIPYVRATTAEQDSKWANTAQEGCLGGYPGFFELDAQQRWESDSIWFLWPERPEPAMSECTIHVKVEFMDARGVLWSRWDRSEPVRQPVRSVGRIRLALSKLIDRVDDDDDDDEDD